MFYFPYYNITARTRFNHNLFPCALGTESSEVCISNAIISGSTTSNRWEAPRIN